MSELVLDANIIVKLLVEEPGSPLARSMVGDASARGAGLIAPGHAAAEVAEVISRKRRLGLLSEDQAKAVTAQIGSLVAEASLTQLIVPASSLAAAHGTSVYDALYVALAAIRNAPLVTADIRLVRAFGDSSYRDLLIGIDDRDIIFYGEA